MDRTASSTSSSLARSRSRGAWYLGLIVLLLIYARSITMNVGEKNLIWDEAVIALSGLDLHTWTPELFTNTYDTIVHFVQAYPYYPPLLPILLSFSYAIFGLSEFSVRIVSLTSGFLFPLLVFLFGREGGDEATGFLAALMLAASPTQYWMSRFGFVDMPMSFLFTATLYLFYTGYERGELRRIVLAGFTLGFAFLFKYPAILCLPIILGYFILDVLISRRIGWRKAAAIILASEVALFIVLPWVYLTTTLSWKWQVWGHEISPGKEYKWLMLENWTGSIINMPDQMTLLIAVIAGLGLVYSAWRREKIDRMILLWFAVVFLWFVPYHKDTRYTMPFIPALVIAGSRLILASLSGLSAALSKKTPDQMRANGKGGRFAILGVVLVLVLVAPSFAGWLTFVPDRAPVREAVAYVARNIEGNRSVMVLVPDNDLSQFAVYFYLRMGGLPYGSGVHVYTIGKTSEGELDSVELLADCYRRRIQYLMMSDFSAWSADWVRFLTEDHSLRGFFSLERVFRSDPGGRIVYVLSYHGSLKQL